MRLFLCLLLLVGFAVAQEAGQIQETNPHYTITMRYPKFANAALNKAGEEYCQMQAASFKKDFQETTGGKGDGRRPWSLDADYTLPYKSDKVQVVYFQGAMDLGGAHPGPFCKSFVLDQQTGKPLTLQDQFKGDYLKVLSRYCLAQLVKKKLSNDDGWLQKGAGPTAENYDVGYPTEKGYLVIFPVYQVAPYVDGPQEVLVPWSELKGNL